MLEIAGTIGAGKTSLGELLRDRYHSNLYKESVDDNPYLAKFYEDPETYAFLLQLYFLDSRLNSIRQALNEPNEVGNTDLNILDRSIYEDSLLFHLNADLGRANSDEVEMYDKVLDNMLTKLGEAEQDKRPDLLIYISVDFDTMLSRIGKRGRSFEQIDYDPSLYNYYKELNARYDKWFDQYNESPKMKIDGTALDFVEDTADCEAVMKSIDKKLRSLDLLHFYPTADGQLDLFDNVAEMA